MYLHIIIGGILLNGGSYFSYKNSSCPELTTDGGCPDKTEQLYDDGTYAFSLHPYVLLLSTTDDFYIGDTNIPAYYYDQMTNESVPAMMRQGRSDRHGALPCQINTALQFIKDVVHAA